MKKTLFFVSSILILAALACSFSASTANIAGAKMAHDSEGNDPTTVFAQDETFYAVVELANAPDDTKVKSVWTAVEADGVDSNSLIDEVETTSSDAQLYFELSNDEKMWPVGKYKVDLFLNDELDRTLEFEVEGEVAAAPEPEPTTAPAEEPEPTPAPTEEPESTPTEETQASSAGDSLGSGSSTGDSPPSKATEEEETEPVALAFQPEPYVHPSGAFSFALPEGWEVTNEGDFSASAGDDNSIVGAEFFNADTIYDETLMQTFIELYLDNFILSGEYEVLSQEEQPDGSMYVAVTSESSKGAKIDSDFFFEQRDTIVFIFYFSTFTYDEIQPTWNEIIASYAVDSEAALAVAPAATPTVAPTLPPPPPPTPTPAPAVNPALAPPPGLARVYLQNSFTHEYNIDFGDGGGSIQVAPGAENVYHDMSPGKYHPGLSIAGGNAINVDIEVGADQSWMLLVGADGRLKWGQVYP